MLSNHPNCLGGNGPSASSDLIGDVDGPASATDNAVARFDGTTGKLIQNSTVTISDTTGDIAGAQSLTAPASTNLTLAGGSSGASLVLEQGASGVGSLSRRLSVTAVDAAPPSSGTTVVGGLRLVSSNNVALDLGINGNSSPYPGWLQVSDATNQATHYPLVLQGTGSNVLIGGTTDITGSGGLKVFGTTAGSSSAGALVVAGGLATGAASYIGGGLTVNGPSNDYNFIRNNATNSTPQLRLDNLATENSGVLSGMTFRINATAYADIAAQPNGGVFSDTTAGFYIISRSATAAMKFVTGAYNNTPAFTLAAGSTGAATFAGAVTATTVNATTAAGGFTMSQSASGEVTIVNGRNTNAGTDASVRILLGNNSNASAAQIQMYGSNDATYPNVFRVGTSTSGTTMIGTINNATITTTSSTGFAISSGLALKLGNPYVGTPVVSTGYITIQDSTGTTYKVAVSL